MIAEHPRLPAYLSGAVVIVIIGACFNMAFLMHDGFPTGNTVAERALFISRHVLLWRLGWLNWMLAALGLLLFCNLLLAYIPASSLRRYGILLVAIGIGPDVSAEAIYAFVLPELARNGDLLNGFSILEQVAMQLTGTVGNGAYNLGGLLLNLLLRGNPRVPPWLVYSGLPAWILGIGLSVATALGHHPLAVLLTAAAMTWSVSWMLLVTVTLFWNPHRYRLQRHEH